MGRFLLKSKLIAAIEEVMAYKGEFNSIVARRILKKTGFFTIEQIYDYTFKILERMVMYKIKSELFSDLYKYIISELLLRIINLMEEDKSGNN